MKSAKVGRNDNCPCGSGRKYKRCCLRGNGGAAPSRPVVPTSILEHHLRMVHQKSEQERRYGKVRPVIHADWRGKKWIAVGDRVLASEHWKTFVDFLQDYIKFVLTPEWGRAELQLPLERRHTVMQWYDGVCDFQRQHVKVPGAIASFSPNGTVAAYFSLAYDLYLLNHHQKLQQVLVERLRNPTEFQGARYELFAIATGIRAGFEIALEDESDGSSKHPEYIATHPSTGQRIAIECKSRRREGVLGHPGVAAAGDERAGINRLVNNGLPHERWALGFSVQRRLEPLGADVA
jgi:hypothetical protein